MVEKKKQDESRHLLFRWRFAFMRGEGLTSTQKVVMHTLGAYMDLDGRGCVLGHARIARESSLARGTVIRTIQELAGRWLTVTNRRSSCGDADTNDYCAVIPQGVVSQDDHLVPQDNQGGLTGRLGVVSHRMTLPLRVPLTLTLLSENTGRFTSNCSVVGVAHRSSLTSVGQNSARSTVKRSASSVK